MPAQLMPPLDNRALWAATGSCPIEATMEIVGSRAAMLIMREASYGTTRFDDFAERAGMAPATASAHLAELVAAGLLSRESYQEPGARRRAEYRLTESGVAFVPVILALFQWGAKYRAVPDGLTVAHAACGADVRVETRCTRGHEVPLDELAIRLSR
ncbi:winged helix-turn-helix transcriptional regulator [Microbacterium sp. NPDC077663]|uniref:winged helix-turn-helix transcriptional regulator n=1 Tax=Microbacterium sp. NPDC077663 TaxID=3364189 RepID=UPI0037C546D5